MWIKICGIRDLETAQAVAACGVQAIGLNFFDRSPRVVSPDVAADIVSRIPAEVEPVGLFVNHSVEHIHRLAAFCRLRTVQLHGDEPPETIAELARYRVIRAFRVGHEGLSEVAEYIERCRELGALPWACLVDARVEGVYGGTGMTVSWETIAREYRVAEWPPLILAGGLRPENVASAIRTTNPWGVDVAGGVEASSGVKEMGRVRAFVEGVQASLRS